jgi:hypothetical protein
VVRVAGAVHHDLAAVGVLGNPRITGAGRHGHVVHAVAFAAQVIAAQPPVAQIGRAFHHQHPFAGVRQCPRGGSGAGTAADDDGVIVLGHPARFDGRQRRWLDRPHSGRNAVEVDHVDAGRPPSPSLGVVTLPAHPEQRIEERANDRTIGSAPQDVVLRPSGQVGEAGAGRGRVQQPHELGQRLGGPREHTLGIGEVLADSPDPPGRPLVARNDAINGRAQRCRLANGGQPGVRHSPTIRAARARQRRPRGCRRRSVHAIAVLQLRAVVAEAAVGPVRIRTGCRPAPGRFAAGRRNARRSCTGRRPRCCRRWR